MIKQSILLCLAALALAVPAQAQTLTLADRVKSSSLSRDDLPARARCSSGVWWKVGAAYLQLLLLM
jgi:hypothetical protein